MRNKKILITGANGYIGKNITKFLLDNGYHVIAVDYKVDNIDSRSKIIEIDLFNLDVENLYEYFNKPDILLHLAWRDGFVHNSSRHINDFSSHFSFITRMVEEGVKHVATIGTMHEVGHVERAVDEFTSCNPTTQYGLAKLFLRKSLEIYFSNHKDVVFQWLRIYYIVGDDKYNNSVFTKIIQMERESKKTFPMTSGNNKYDFIDIQLLSEYISRSILQTEIKGIINCSTGKPISLRTKIEEFLRINNYKIIPNFGEFPDREYDSPVVYGDNEKINRIISKTKKEL